MGSRIIDTNAWAILAKLLEMASDEFSNHGCNDFVLDNTHENFALVTAVEQWASHEEPLPVNVDKDEDDIYTSDDTLMGFFASIAREWVTGLDLIHDVQKVT